MRAGSTFVDDEDYDPDHYLPMGELRRALKAIRKLPNKSIIVLHGPMNRGKTSTGRWLQRETGLPLISLDEFALGAGRGFDEAEMRLEIGRASEEGTVIVEGVCACRVCTPDFLITFGPKRIGSPSQNPKATKTAVEEFIGDYDPWAYKGRKTTLNVQTPHDL